MKLGFLPCLLPADLWFCCISILSVIWDLWFWGILCVIDSKFMSECGTTEKLRQEGNIFNGAILKTVSYYKVIILYKRLG